MKIYKITIVVFALILSLTSCEEKKVAKKETKEVAKIEKPALTVKSTENKIIRESHRGESLNFPENTMAAYKEAVRLGTDRIELDVNITADGVLVIMHDKTLDRTTNGKGKVTETKYAVIEKLEAGSWKDAKFKNEHVPTLEQVFEFAKKNNVMLNLDLKEEATAISMAKLAQKMDMVDNIIITGKIPQSVKDIRSVDPSITMFYEIEKEDVLKDPIKQVKDIRNANVPGCLLDFKGLSATFIKECKKHGIAISVYGIETEKDMITVINKGVDAVMVDDVALLNKVTKK